MKLCAILCPGATLYLYIKSTWHALDVLHFSRAQFLLAGRAKNMLHIYVRHSSKSALGWLAIKGEWWMPRLEKAMKDAA